MKNIIVLLTAFIFSSCSIFLSTGEFTKRGKGICGQHKITYEYDEIWKYREITTDILSSSFFKIIIKDSTGRVVGLSEKAKKAIDDRACQTGAEVVYITILPNGYDFTYYEIVR